MSKRFSILIAGLICGSLFIFCILNKPLFFTPPPFHTYSPIMSSKGLMSSLKREKNYIDCYGNVWFFDERLNQIVILQAGNEFLRKNSYIEYEKKYEFVEEDGTSSYHYVGIRHCGSNWSVADNLKQFRQKFGYDMAFTSSRNNIVVFEGTSKESVVEISPDTLIVGLSGNYKVYPIKENTAEYFTYSSGNIFDYDTAIEYLEKGITNKEKCNAFHAIMTGWQKSHDCRAFDAPLLQTIKTSDENF